MSGQAAARSALVTGGAGSSGGHLAERAAHPRCRAAWPIRCERIQPARVKRRGTTRGGPPRLGASGTRTSLNSLWVHIREIVGSRIEARHAPARAGDVRDSFADLSRARDLLGYRPAVALREGLRRAVESFRGSRPH